jgi:hypothetical protein
MTLAMSNIVGQALAQSAEEAMARARDLTRSDDCTASSTGDNIIVCGRKADRYRLPLRENEGDDLPSGNRRGDIARVSLDRVMYGDCGPFQGQRQCSRSEAKHYGYGNGRDPITALVTVARKLIDPDAEIGQPVSR